MAGEMSASTVEGIRAALAEGGGAFRGLLFVGPAVMAASPFHQTTPTSPRLRPPVRR
jgi:hypothetical protein